MVYIGQGGERVYKTISLSMRGKKAPLLRGAVVGIGLGLYDIIIIHSVNNILILLSMINSVNVKKIDT